MNISELIVELQKIKDKEGNLPVYIPGSGWGSGSENEIDMDSFDIRNEKYTKDSIKNLLYPKRLTLL